MVSASSPRSRERPHGRRAGDDAAGRRRGRRLGVDGLEGHQRPVRRRQRDLRRTSPRSSTGSATRPAWWRAACATSRTNVIGVLVADFEPFSTEVLKGAADAIRGTGYELVAYSAGGRVDEHVGWERRYLSRVMGTLVDGAVLVTPTVTDVQYDGPIVAVDPHTGPSRLPTVAADNLQGARLGVDHLLEPRPHPHRHGHRPAGPRSPPSCASRATARRSPRPASPVDEALLRLGALRARATRATPPASCLTLPDPPTAIFAANDLSALATLEVAAELGIDVPGQLSVVGFDNIPESALARPAADHRRAADPADGPRRDRDAHRADRRRGARGDPRDPGHRRSSSAGPTAAPGVAMR